VLFAIGERRRKRGEICGRSCEPRQTNNSSRRDGLTVFSNVQTQAIRRRDKNAPTVSLVYA
jgi:hypothetical protein